MYSGKISRGDIVNYIKFSVEKVGSEEYGPRPAIVVQNNVGNRFSTTFTIIPLAAIENRSKENLLPTQVIVTNKNLKKVSYSMAEQICTIDRKRILNNIGKLDAKTMKKIEMSLMVQLNLAEVK